MNAYVLALTLLSAAGTHTVWAGQPEEAFYRDRLAFAEVQVSGGFTLSRGDFAIHRRDSAGGAKQE